MSQWYAIHKLTHLDITIGQVKMVSHCKYCFFPAPLKCHLELSSIIDRSSSSLQGLIKMLEGPDVHGLPLRGVCVGFLSLYVCVCVGSVQYSYRNACGQCLSLASGLSHGLSCAGSSWEIRPRLMIFINLLPSLTGLNKTTLLSIFPYLLCHAIGSTALVWLAVDRPVLPQARYSP